jgi:hypothetical protein
MAAVLGWRHSDGEAMRNLPPYFAFPDLSNRRQARHKNRKSDFPCPISKVVFAVSIPDL